MKIDLRQENRDLKESDSKYITTVKCVTQNIDHVTENHDSIQS